MTQSDLEDLKVWAAAHAPAGSRTAQLVLLLLAEHAELAAIWDHAVATYPEGVPMSEPVQKWWRALYHRITGRKR